MRILMTGGGTAGHVNPALAIAATLKAHHPDADILFAASAQPSDKAVDLVPRAGYDLCTIHIKGLQRPLWTPSNLALPYYLIRSRREAGRLIREFRPDLIVGTGGFACYPLCRRGADEGIPTVVHESNALPGKAVQMLKSRVNLVLVNFEDTVTRLQDTGKTAPIVRVGNPVMPHFTAISRREAREKLGLSEDDRFILSFGGSLGAKFLNNAVLRLANRLTEEGRRTILLHAAGKRDYDRMLAEWKNSRVDGNDRMRLVSYIYDMPCQMAAADLVISRAGAMSVSELSLLGKAAVLVPSPYVAENHQYRNAMALVKAGAGVCVEESALADGELETAVLRLLDDPAGRHSLETHIREAFACPDANERIYSCLMQAMNQQTPAKGSDGW